MNIHEGDTEDPVAASTWVWSLMFVAVFVVTSLCVTAIAYNVRRGEDEAKLYEAPLVELEVLEAEQNARLEGGPRMVNFINELQNPDESLVIPIDRAMEAVAEEFGN